MAYMTKRVNDRKVFQPDVFQDIEIKLIVNALNYCAFP